MKLLLDKLGDLNPQLLRELKGRIDTIKVSIAGIICCLSQFLLLIVFFQKLPDRQVADPGIYIVNQYCVKVTKTFGKLTGVTHGSNGQCFVDSTGHLIIKWNLWWFDIFLCLSCIGLVVLLVAGTYMLISDLATEERRGTLNFLRLAPQPSHNILLGKMLGVPVLIFFAAMLAAPLHFWAGVSAGISPLWIFMYDGAVVASCIFFYSAAMLFGLVNFWMGRLQAWLGSGFIIGLLWFYWWVFQIQPSYFSLNVMTLFNPWFLIPYLISPLAITEKSWIFSIYYTPDIYDYWFNWYYWPVGTSFYLFLGMMLCNLAIWTYWIWQGLNRRFSNANIPWLTRAQSYAMVVYIETLAIGFSIEQYPVTIFGCTFTPAENHLGTFLPITVDSLYCLLLGYNLIIILSINFWLGWLLVLSLSPARASVIEWAAARYLKTKRSSGWLWRDLIFGETSPPYVSIGISFLLIAVILTGWIELWPLPISSKITGWLAALFVSVITVALILIWQIILLADLKFFRRYKSVILIILNGFPLVLFSQKYSLYSQLHSLFDLLDSSNNISNSVPIILVAIVAHIYILAVLSFWLNRQLRMAGKSASQAMLASKR